MTKNVSKPKIDDVINDVLIDEKRKNALAFVAYLRANKMNPGWAATNTWTLKHKGKLMLTIRLTGADYFTHRKTIESDSWLISPPFDRTSDYNDVPIDGFKETVWANVNYCAGCIKCRPGNTYTLIGKQFNSVCNSMVVFVNPGADEIECVKQLMEHSIKAADKHGTPSKPLLDLRTDGLKRVKDISASCEKLFNGKYAMFYADGNEDIMFHTDKPITVKMYGLTTYKEDKLPKSWTLYGANSVDGSWELLDTQTKADVFNGTITYYTEKAFPISSPEDYQFYKLALHSDGRYFLSQVHLYIQ